MTLSWPSHCLNVAYNVRLQPQHQQHAALPKSLVLSFAWTSFQLNCPWLHFDYICMIFTSNWYNKIDLLIRETLRNWEIFGIFLMMCLGVLCLGEHKKCVMKWNEIPKHALVWHNGIGLHMSDTDMTPEIGNTQIQILKYCSLLQ